jgi:hypothetical protein
MGEKWPRILPKVATFTSLLVSLHAGIVSISIIINFDLVRSQDHSNDSFKEGPVQQKILSY